MASVQYRSLPVAQTACLLHSTAYKAGYDELPLLLNVKQMVDLMGVSDSSIYELIQEDDFPSLRIGKRIVVPKEELRKWITAHTKGASGC